MKRNATPRSILAAAIVGITISSAWAAPTTIRALDVDADLLGIDGASALSYYPQVETDLETKLREVVVLDDDPDGYRIDVSLERVSLDGDTALPDSMEFNQMEGIATISSPETDAAPRSFPIMVTATSAEIFVPEGFKAGDPATSEFYDALLNGFASEVAKLVPETMRDASSR